MTIVFRNTPAFPFIFYISLFYSALVLSAQPIMVSIRPPIDISYGVYLYGFPVQQAVRYYLPDISVYSHQAIALLIAIILGTFSWMTIEKRAIELGKKMRRSIPFINKTTTVVTADL
jgi:peptidoglycan/LPS O-acetylase OafA/YrhL